MIDMYGSDFFVLPNLRTIFSVTACDQLHKLVPRVVTGVGNHAHVSKTMYISDKVLH